MNFEDALSKLRQTKESEDAFTASIPHQREDWVSAIEALYHEIEEAITESAQAPVPLPSNKGYANIDDGPLGQYVVPTLEISLYSEKLRFQPSGTMLVGAAGRVEMSLDRRGATKKVDFVRMVQDGKPSDIWTIRLSTGLRSAPTTQGTPEVVNRETIRNAILYLLG
ncbi:hypothetical protein Gbth_003_062 [Gluconobacter thailandicus F149-1 = NBRC 100600]|uniref:hypothetical protein n=1 Tax=Gluconobacter thailandicus TaxID=257438 RepID=UPI00054D034C|nr:hypothetical protein [Gluconobacter thailandicus]KXV53564.1 hypothetical protein AD946_07475 [Gluconobacter thailandicus]GAN91988.1 hypothetical protein Gbth_003_062 [Gluconobacter thailandicus F149-1 = NBRC 100600]GBR61689.1 hypothetical protein AA100600_3020 [Gluconobacter thailandicus F149-1 = NBRC 100600]GEL87710.1 hypothetical protein GTH01_20680 [Gluconobacter thailandicus F149-1 = NBRC 100600]